MKYFQLILQIFSGIIKFFNNRTLRKAGEDAEKQKATEAENEILKAKNEVNPVTNYDDALDGVSEYNEDKQ